MTDPDSNVIKEVVAQVFRILLAHAKRNEKPYLTRTSLQKTLYALRCELPPSNYVRFHLAYYWYRAGAFSEYVAEAIDEMIDANQLEIERRPSYELISLPRAAEKKRFWKHDKPFLEAASGLEKIVLDFRVRGAMEEIQDQYWLQAPLSFYPQFRLRFKPQLQTFAVHALMSRPLTENQLRELQESIQKLSACLPNVSVFSEFKKTYFDYATALMRLIASKNQPKELAIAASKISAQIWDTFAYGARLLTYDPPYKKKLEQWEIQFYENILEMRKTVQPFYRRVTVRVGMQFGEEVISKQLFVERMIEFKRASRLLWIRAERIPKDLKEVGDFVGEDIVILPEFDYFVRGDALDSPVIDRLDLDSFRRVIERYVEDGRIYVAITDPEIGVKHLTFEVVKEAQSTLGTVTV